ncbi:hypothetical protein JYU20_04740, partial [Bacteroidales bacterium AH-315-I05]|nr:hypothetical protein [Bacteroidales bacterium AH-315-I05]
VSPIAPAANNVMKYNSISTQWEPANDDAYFIQGTTVSAIAPAGGQVLTYNAISSEWEPQTATADGDWTITGTNIYNSNSGNVGIGTAVPLEKLELGAIVSPATSTTSQSSSGRIALTGSYWTGATEIKHRFNLQNVASTTVNETGRLAINWDATELVSVLNNGNVGIGTNSPARLLDVSGNAGLGNNLSALPTDAYIGISVAFNSRHGLYIRDSNNSIGDVSHGALWIENVGLGGHTFYAADQSSDASPFVIDNAGNVGIGTTGPGAKLEVAGQVKITGGTPTADEVLTTDATGLATWQPRENKCPTGFTAANKQFCIEDNERAAATWFVAAQTCGDADARLCTWSEWYYACNKLVLTAEINNWEWVEGDSNANGSAKVVGSGSITSDSGATTSSSFSYRCCFGR